MYRLYERRKEETRKLHLKNNLIWEGKISGVAIFYRDNVICWKACLLPTRGGSVVPEKDAELIKVS